VEPAAHRQACLAGFGGRLAGFGGRLARFGGRPGRGLRPAAYPAAEVGLAFGHRDPDPALGQASRSGQARDAGAHHDRVRPTRQQGRVRRAVRARCRTARRSRPPAVVIQPPGSLQLGPQPVRQSGPPAGAVTGRVARKVCTTSRCQPVIVSLVHPGEARLPQPAAEPLRPVEVRHAAAQVAGTRWRPRSPPGRTDDDAPGHAFHMSRARAESRHRVLVHRQRPAGAQQVTQRP